MIITVKCYATLSDHQPENSDAYEIPDGMTLGGLMDRLGLAPDDVKLPFVNGVKVALETVLKDGDRVGLFPAVGGG